MSSIFQTLREIFDSNESCLGKVNPDIAVDSEKFGKWMSTFLVRRVKRELLTEDMLRDSLCKKTCSDNFDNDIKILEEKSLIFFVKEYVLVTELGVFVHLSATKENILNYHREIESYIQEGQRFIAKGLISYHGSKFTKLFPQNLGVREVSFVVFLLLNGAYSQSSAFTIKETSSKFLVDIRPIVDSLQLINNKLFNEINEITMDDKEFSNFMRRNTGNGTIGRVFDKFYIHHYDRGSSERRIQFDIIETDLDKDLIFDNLSEVIEILVDSVKGLAEKELFLKNLRELVVIYMLENPLAAHQQLTFFNNSNYRESLYLLLTVIDDKL